MKGMRGKCRTRTWLRMHLPWSIADQIPKGAHDCGDHEWHQAEENAWRCAHCSVGETHESPWSPDEALGYSLEALGGILERSSARGLAEFEKPIVARLSAEVSEAIRHSIAESRSTGGPSSIADEPTGAQVLTRALEESLATATRSDAGNVSA